ncbi:MAG: monovalent cation/H+ antiporter complex subunit F [Eubacteriales bacterium]
MSQETYSTLYFGLLAVLALSTFPYLLRTIIGPTFFDRVLAVNNISTQVIMMICILAVVQNEHYLVDVALIYSMLGFVTVVILCKAYLRSHDKEGDTEFRTTLETTLEKEAPKHD